MVHKRYTVAFLCIMVACFQRVTCTFGFSQNELNILVHRSGTVKYLPPADIDYAKYRNLTVNFETENSFIVYVDPKSLAIISPEVVTLIIKGLAPGKSDVTAKILSEGWNLTSGFTVVNVHKSDVVVIISNIIGWTYFFAWAMSFYPQIWTNFKRKSVVGLNFDFVSLNIVGFTCYSIFNVGLYAIPVIREEYAERYPVSVVPVLIQDLVFALHGTLMTIITGIQCFIYESKTQRVSVIGKSFHAAYALILLVSIFLANFNYMKWLDFMYICSYIKLLVTVTKFLPQVYMNYRRKSTVGWNINNILWDLAGGILCIFQMFLNAHNYDEWESLIENPSKFWLGNLTILFDLIFILQHYVLYKGKEDHDAVESGSENVVEEEKYFISKTSLIKHLT